MGPNHSYHIHLKFQIEISNSNKKLSRTVWGITNPRTGVTGSCQSIVSFMTKRLYYEDNRIIWLTPHDISWWRIFVKCKLFAFVISCKQSIEQSTMKMINCEIFKNRSNRLKFGQNCHQNVKLALRIFAVFVFWTSVTVCFDWTFMVNANIKSVHIFVTLKILS